MAKFYDGYGNIVDVGSVKSGLNGADVFDFGDSNFYYSMGHDLSDIGSVYQRLSLEFSINSWTNKGKPGYSSWQGYRDLFYNWVTDETVAQYNKESTIFLFGLATNDTLDAWTPEYTGNPLNTINATEAVHGISEIIAEKFPKVQYHWIIPPETDWSKWTGSTEPDARNMAEKMPYIIKRLEEVQFPYCDMYHTSGITSEMLADGIHLGGGCEDYTTDAVYKYYRRLREYLMSK